MSIDAGRAEVAYRRVDLCFFSLAQEGAAKTAARAPANGR
jgi:hypothetical protein